MANDSKGRAVQYGDYVAFTDVIVRIVKIAETPKGVTAVGAYVDLVGTGRVAKIDVDIAKSTLVMTRDGTTVGDGTTAASRTMTDAKKAV